MTAQVSTTPLPGPEAGVGAYGAQRDSTPQRASAQSRLTFDGVLRGEWIKLLSLLAAEEELCVCDIAESLQMGQSAISHQLRVLRAARLVKFRKAGKEAFYSLDDDHVVKLMRQGLEHVRES